LPIIEQLESLRRRLLMSLAVFLVFAAAVYGMNTQVFELASAPFVRALPEVAGGLKGSLEDNLIYINPLEAFSARLKLSLYAGFLLCCPLFFRLGWLFAVGIGLVERRYVWLLTLSCSLFFWGGTVFSYYLIMPLALRFFLSFSSPVLSATWSVGRYTDFLIQFTLVFGLVFELPMIMLVLGRLGLVNVKLLRAQRGYVLVAIFLLAALFTPPDIVTQLFLGIPLVILFEFSLFLVQWTSQAAGAGQEDDF